jgi:FkbM family methyltransferase
MRLTHKIGKKNIVINAREKTYDLLIFNEVVRANQYELPVELGGTFIDVGGHIGTFAVMCSLLGATVYTFEPIIDNFNLLEQNILENKCNAIACNKAVTSDGRDITLNESENKINTGGYYIDGKGEIKVKSISIHDVLKDHEQVNLLKLDCEGAEYEILEALTDAEFKKIKNIVMEWHISNRKALKLKRYLEGKGYKCTYREIRENLGFLKCISTL